MFRRRLLEIFWTYGDYFYAYYTALALWFLVGLLITSDLLTLLTLRHPVSFWNMTLWVVSQIIPAILIIWVGRIFWKTTSMTILVRRQDDAHYLEYLIQKQTAHLLYLRSNAQWENARQYLWSHRHQPGPQLPLTELCRTLPIARYAGFFSWYFTVKSSYLQLPLPEPGAPVVEGSLVVIQENEQRAGVSEEEQASTEAIHISGNVPFLAIDRNPPTYAILIFGDNVRFQVRSHSTVEIPMTIGRPQELLVYLALVASERTILGEDIRHDIYEAQVSLDEDAGKTEQKLHNDSKAIRTFFESYCVFAGVPYIDPIKTTRGKGASWRLSQKYVLLDIERMKELAQRLPELKQQTEAVDRKSVRAAYEAVIKTLESGLLGKLVERGRIGSWINPYVNRYREMYLQLLWDIAEWEEIGSHQVAEQEEQEECRRRAASRYEKCAFARIPDGKEGAWPEGQAHMSEMALQHSLELYGQLGEIATVEGVFSAYHDRMRALKKDYDFEKPTIRIYKKAIGSTLQS